MSWLTDPASDPREPEALFDDPDLPASAPGQPTAAPRPRSRIPLVVAGIAGWLIVSVIVLAVLLAVRGPSHSSKNSTAGSGPSTPAATATGNAPVPAGFVQRAADDQADCAAHSYGQIRSFFARTPCLSVHRVLSTTERNRRTVVVASYGVRFASAAGAAQYNTLVARDGTGNISDLLREGRTFAGGPARLPTAAFASRQAGASVFVAEAAYAQGASDSSDAVLLDVARQAVAAG
jgi:hypothetical protein